ncbi:MAG: hypothetical protein ACR2J4_04890, partial [Deinococcus sp.]
MTKRLPATAAPLPLEAYAAGFDDLFTQRSQREGFRRYLEGLLLPELDELFLYAVTSRVTSDCLVDRLAQWWAAVRERLAHTTP